MNTLYSPGLITSLFGFLLINLPEMLLGNESTPYEFTDRGYYERYAEEFEEDYGYQYFEQKEHV